MANALSSSVQPVISVRQSSRLAWLAVRGNAGEPSKGQRPLRRSLLSTVGAKQKLNPSHIN